MTEPPSPKNTDAASVDRDKTAAVSPPGASAPQRSESPAAVESDRTIVIKQDIPAGDEEGTILAPPASGRARLVLQGADGNEQEIPLVQPETTIGRSTGCDIILQAPTVSRVHARIAQQGVGFLLIPVGTRQNTYVNNELVSHPRLLQDGDRIQLANEQLLYRFDAGPSRADPPPSRKTPMLVAFAAALLTVAAVFFVWRQTHPSSAIRVENPEPAEVQALKEDQEAHERQAALVQQAREEAERRQREEEAQQAEERRANEERLRQEEARRVEAQVRKYLYEGDVAFLEKRYTTPPEGSAVFAYREALQLDPDNERALAQTAKIIDEYLSWAESAAAQGHRTRARQHYERALYVHKQVPSAGDEDSVRARLSALRDSLELN